MPDTLAGIKFVTLPSLFGRTLCCINTKPKCNVMLPCQLQSTSVVHVRHLQPTPKWLSLHCHGQSRVTLPHTSQLCNT